MRRQSRIALRARDLDLDPVDHGFDFYVTPVEVREDDPEDLSSHFEVAGYKVEVKTTIGRDIPTGETLSFIHNAETSDVPIRNTTALRYAVPSELWEEGLDLDEWVDTAFPNSKA